MSTIIPLPFKNCNHAPSDVCKSKVAHGNDEGDGKQEKETGLGVMDEFVDFLLKKGDKDMIANFQQCLSDFSRHKGHAFDSQLERIDEWKCREKRRYEEMCDAIKDILKEPKYIVQRDFYDIHDNKLE